MKLKFSPSLLIQRRMQERMVEVKKEGWGAHIEEGPLRITCWMDAVEEYLDGKLK